jgi:hypothetical protein
MSGWLGAVLLAVALMVGTWALLVRLARRLPPGLLRDLARFVPDCVTTIRRLRRDPRVPRRAKVAVALALRYAARQVPRDVLVERGRVSLGRWNACSPAQRQPPASAWEPALASGPIVSCEAGGQQLLWRLQ